VSGEERDGELALRVHLLRLVLVVLGLVVEVVEAQGADAGGVAGGIDDATRAGGHQAVHQQMCQQERTDVVHLDK
jgi:hypothetical protein